MWDYEKSSVVTYPFYIINCQSIHKTSCMQRIKKILMWKVYLAPVKTQLLQYKGPLIIFSVRGGGGGAAKILIHYPNFGWPPS